MSNCFHFRDLSFLFGFICLFVFVFGFVCVLKKYYYFIYHWLVFVWFGLVIFGYFCFWFSGLGFFLLLRKKFSSAKKAAT